MSGKDEADDEAEQKQDLAASTLEEADEPTHEVSFQRRGAPMLHNSAGQCTSEGDPRHQPHGQHGPRALDCALCGAFDNAARTPLLSPIAAVDAARARGRPPR